ncbi:MAG: RtcB family protein [Proteobacteria bacterium]|nr:RtcB family protein [Pseudomonadota bacterium]
MSQIGGKLLLSWGIEPGPNFKAVLAEARRLEAEGMDLEAIAEAVCAMFPKPAILKRRLRGTFAEAIAAETPEDEANIESVRAHMAELMRCPVLEHGAIMPDACPAGSAKGTIPVGGAVVSRAIHPAFHSADICCSMYATVFPEGVETSAFMDAVKASTRFGPGGRAPENQIVDPVTDEIEQTKNPFLSGLSGRAKAQLCDQGDGNHFAYLGSLEVTQALLDKLTASGQAALAQSLGEAGRRVNVLVTHHGSRDLGAQVYKRGIAAAVQHTKVVSPDTPQHQAWIDPDTETGALYWDALMYVARWTKRNHQLVHEQTLARLGISALAEFGNEHNFVWKRGDRYFHGKGATPAWRGDDGHPLLGLIPLNMAAPILLTLGGDREEYASFSPHGAGRNKSRSALLREHGLAGLMPEEFLQRSRALMERQTEGLDVRFFYDRPDVSESPIAYKSANQVREQIERFGLADVIAVIEPKGSIMAGDYDKPWMTKTKRA